QRTSQTSEWEFRLCGAQLAGEGGRTGRRLAHKDARREKENRLEVGARHGTLRVGTEPNAVKKIPTATDIHLTVTGTFPQTGQTRERAAHTRTRRIPQATGRARALDHPPRHSPRLAGARH